MSNIGGSSGDVVIKLRLDTSQAEADLKRFQAGVGAATVVTGRMTGGGGVRPGMGGVGSGGLNIGGLLGSALAFSPFALAGGMDLARGLGSAATGLGSAASEALGFADFRRNMGVPMSAARKVVDQLGMAGKYATEGQIKTMYEFESRIEGGKADAENRVMGVLGQEVAVDVMLRLTTALENLLKFFTGGSPTSNGTIPNGVR